MNTLIRVLTSCAVAGVFWVGASARAETFIVKNGEPGAAIVTAAKPCSSVKLAATELRDYIEKISGVRLPIKDETAGVWTVEARIPFTASRQDPLHEVVGPPPSAEQPWYFNICRQRSRNQREDVEMTAFSPTESKGFHKILKFAKLTAEK